ncbi:MAG: hypothetical protein ACXV74_03450 [Methylobacter sp.]
MSFKASAPSATAPALLSHKDVVAAIAPGNLAAFSPSLKVNVENAWGSFLSTSCITHGDVENVEK